MAKVNGFQKPLAVATIAALLIPFPSFAQERVIKNSTAEDKDKAAAGLIKYATKLNPNINEGALLEGVPPETAEKIRAGRVVPGKSAPSFKLEETLRIRYDGRLEEFREKMEKEVIKDLEAAGAPEDLARAYYHLTLCCRDLGDLEGSDKYFEEWCKIQGILTEQKPGYASLEMWEEYKEWNRTRTVVTVESEPEGAAVEAAGYAYRGYTPVSFDNFDFGRRYATIRISKPHYHAREAVITIKPGYDNQYTVELPKTHPWLWLGLTVLSAGALSGLIYAAETGPLATIPGEDYTGDQRWGIAGLTTGVSLSIVGIGTGIYGMAHGFGGGVKKYYKVPMPAEGVEDFRDLHTRYLKEEMKPEEYRAALELILPDLEGFDYPDAANDARRELAEVCKKLGDDDAAAKYSREAGD